MQHSNVIKVTDLIDAGDIVAFVMEYIEGVSLEDYIATNAPLSHETIEKLFLQMVVAIDHDSKINSYISISKLYNKVY